MRRTEKCPVDLRPRSCVLRVQPAAWGQARTFRLRD